MILGVIEIPFYYINQNMRVPDATPREVGASIGSILRKTYVEKILRVHKELRRKINV